MTIEFSRELNYGYQVPIKLGNFKPLTILESVGMYNPWKRFMFKVNDNLNESDYIKISAIQFAYDHKVLEF